MILRMGNSVFSMQGKLGLKELHWNIEMNVSEAYLVIVFF